MIARYRRMPRGRPAMPSWDLAETQLLRNRLWTAELLTYRLRQLDNCTIANPLRNLELRALSR